MGRNAAAPTEPDKSNVPDVRAWQHAGSIALFLAVTATVVTGDQLLKSVAFRKVAGSPVVIDPADPDTAQIPAHNPVALVPGILSLQLTTNTGAVFGLGAKGGLRFFIVMSVVATVVIVRIFWRSPAQARVFHIALALILAGALGNLYDRITFSAVRDMLLLFPNVHLPFGWTWHNGEARIYPWIFNLADASLVVGVTQLLLVTYLGERRRSKPSAVGH